MQGQVEEEIHCFFAGVCNLNGQVYCVGGTYGQSGTKYCFRYVEDEDKWQKIASMLTGNLIRSHKCSIYITKELLISLFQDVCRRP